MLTKLRQQLTEELCRGILPFWSTRMVDHVHGGFLGEITGSGEVVADAPKGAIMHARILWTFSAAYRIFGNEEYLLAAQRAKYYLIDKLYDHEFGGVYWSVSTHGEPLQTKKQFYALGFAIYGLSEFARATGDKQALEYAIKLFETIEQQSFDPQNGGYFEAKSRDWQECDDVRLSIKDANEKKTMNTHLHILEPYTNLHRIWKSDRLERRLRELIDLFLIKIKQADNHLGLFFDEDWTIKGGNISYGHDIEASWLLYEAALELNDSELVERVGIECRRIADAAMQGYTLGGGMIYELHDNGVLDTERHWWVQAETIVGLFYLYKFHNNDAALIKAIQTWQYIKDNLIDTQGGEWFWSVTPSGQVNRSDDKAGFWKCPYHNGRMCMEIIEQLSRDHVVE